MAMNLTNQVRSIAQVTKAVAGGDLTKKIEVDVRGEILELKETVNGMTESLSVFADEVTRVAREVGTEGRLGGQARVTNVGGTWKDLTDNVNVMAANVRTSLFSSTTGKRRLIDVVAQLTLQVRTIAVATVRLDFPCNHPLCQSLHSYDNSIHRRLLLEEISRKRSLVSGFLERC